MVEWDTTEEISPWKEELYSLLKKVSGQALIGLGLFIILTDWGILLVSYKASIESFLTETIQLQEKSSQFKLKQIG